MRVLASTYISFTPVARANTISLMAYWVTVRKNKQWYTRIQTNINGLLRELSGPRPLVGSRKLALNRASGITNLRPFSSKLSHPSDTRIGKDGEPTHPNRSKSWPAHLCLVV